MGAAETLGFATMKADTKRPKDPKTPPVALTPKQIGSIAMQLIFIVGAAIISDKGKL